MVKSLQRKSDPKTRIEELDHKIREDAIKELLAASMVAKGVVYCSRLFLLKRKYIRPVPHKRISAKSA